MGGTGKSGGNAGAICDGKFGPQQQGRASRVREAGISENSVAGGIRKPIGVEDLASPMSVPNARNFLGDYVNRPQLHFTIVQKMM